MKTHMKLFYLLTYFKMKKLLFPIVLIFFTTHLWSQEKSTIQWKSMQEALDINKKHKKIMFVDVYTDWCGWCKRMDQSTFQDEQVVEILNTHFIPVKFNAEGSEIIKHGGNTYTNPNPGRSRSTNSFTFVLLGQKVGYPSFAFLDESNNVIGILPGFQQPAQLISVLTYFYTNGYKNQTFDEWLKSQQQ